MDLRVKGEHLWVTLPNATTIVASAISIVFMDALERGAVAVEEPAPGQRTRECLPTSHRAQRSVRDLGCIAKPVRALLQARLSGGALSLKRGHALPTELGCL